MQPKTSLDFQLLFKISRFIGYIDRTQISEILLILSSKGIKSDFNYILLLGTTMHEHC